MDIPWDVIVKILGVLSALVGLVTAIVSRNKTVTHKWEGSPGSVNEGMISQDTGRINQAKPSLGPTEQRSSSEPRTSRLLTLVLRLSIIVTGIAFWCVAVFIPPSHPDQAMKGGFLVLFWASQTICSFVLARMLNRSGILWGFLSLISFATISVILAVLPVARKRTWMEIAREAVEKYKKEHHSSTDCSVQLDGMTTSFFGTTATVQFSVVMPGATTSGYKAIMDKQGTFLSLQRM